MYSHVKIVLLQIEIKGKIKMKNYKIGFIGAGNMAEAIANSLLLKAVFSKENIFISEPYEERRKYFVSKYDVKPCTSNKNLVEKSDIIVLSVKPQMMAEVLKDSFECIGNNSGKKIIISIAAGISCSGIEDIIYSFMEDGKNYPVVRTMPNTPAMAGTGMTGIAGGKFAGEDDIRLVNDIMSSFGKTIVLNEDRINSVTAVSGSGPAYYFYFIEVFVKAAMKLGFSEEDAFMLVFETAKGAVALMEATEELPSSLRKKVTSKGGTTEAALNVLRKSGLEEMIFNAVKAAEQRALELSK